MVLILIKLLISVLKINIIQIIKGEKMKKLKEKTSINGNNFFIPKFRLTINEVCTMLAVGRDKLNRLEKEDPSFPKSIKDGKSRQSAVYYDYQEIFVWYENWKECSRAVQMS